MMLVSKKLFLKYVLKRNTKEAGSYKNICTIAVHCWYIKDAFAGFCWHVFEKMYILEDILEDIVVVSSFHLNWKFVSKSSLPLCRCKCFT